MIRTSKQLGFWMAVVATIVAASQTVPSSLPGWVGEYMAWAAVALGAGLGAYTAGSPSVTLPAERRGPPGG
jgi:hypothetical protein